MTKVLVCDRFHQESFLKLKTEPGFVVKKTNKETIREEIGDADALIIRSGTKITSNFLESCKQLKYIVSCTSGFDHIDLAAVQKKSILSSFTPDANSFAASELAFLLILNSVKSFSRTQQLIKSGNWKRDFVSSSELYGKTLGVVGLGRVGSRVAKIAAGFGMTVKAFDPFLTPEDIEAGPSLVGFEELLRTSDVISVHVPFTKRTKRMFKKNQFDSMQEHAILVNCSRGNVVSEEEMILALDSGKFRGAALDVFEKEPLPPESALAQHNKVICTPHIGGSTEESFFRGSEQARTELIAFFNESKLPASPLPPQKPWLEDCF